MRDLAAHLRHLYVVQTLGEVPDTFSVTAEHTEQLAAQAEALAQGEVAARDRPARRRLSRGQGRLRAAHPARARAAQGRAAAGRHVAAGAAVPDRAARGAARRRGRRRRRSGRRPGGGAPRAAAPGPPPAARAGLGAGAAGRGGPSRRRTAVRGQPAAAAPRPRRPPRPVARAAEPPRPSTACRRSTSSASASWACGGRRRARAERDGRRAPGRAPCPSRSRGAASTIAFPADAAFSKKKAEDNRELRARRAAQPHRPRRSVSPSS